MMTARLTRRIARLERGRGSACPACGGGGPVAYEVVMPVAVAKVPTAGAVRPPGACGACGRAVEYWISFPAARAGGD
ncbi:MAG: hypothetical protein IPJ41_14785 [Phycisphaerales bacterium]|nr:hypothetical protein [Phycisphaerales bacterium]